MSSIQTLKPLAAAFAIAFAGMALHISAARADDSATLQDQLNMTDGYSRPAEGSAQVPAAGVEGRSAEEARDEAASNKEKVDEGAESKMSPA